MPKVSESHRIARRDEILTAAIRCFAEQGYRRTSIADVVRASNLSAGAIYGNFPGGKQELFSAAAGRILDARQEELAERREGSGPLSPGAIVATLIAGIRREPFSAVLLQLWGEAALDEDIRTLVRGVFARLRGFVEERLAEWADANPDRVDGAPRAWAARVTPVVLATAPGFILQRALFDDFDQDAFLEALPEALAH